VNASFELEVIDRAMPENAGRYVFELVAGKASVRDGGDGRLRIDTRALAAIFTGFAHPSELEAAGLVSGSPRDLALLGAAFAGPRPFLLDSF
jgi:predicted acetyltransferase